MSYSDRVILTHATTSCAYTYPVGSPVITQTWLDGSGKVIRYLVNTPRGRYLTGLVARRGIAKKMPEFK